MQFFQHVSDNKLSVTDLITAGQYKFQNNISNFSSNILSQ